MSSTLFARGVTTQVGQRRRHETLEKNISDLQALVAGLKDLPMTVRVLEAKVATLERRVATLEAPRLAAPTGQTVSPSE